MTKLSENFSFNEFVNLRPHLTNFEGLVAVAVKAIKICGDIDVHYVTFFEHRVIWDAVADDLVNRGAA